MLSKSQSINISTLVIDAKRAVCYVKCNEITPFSVWFFQSQHSSEKYFTGTQN